MDYGHTYADKNLTAIEKKMAKEYKKAYKEIKKKADAYFEKFEQADAEYARRVKEGKATEKEYIAWRKSKMLSGSKYRAMLSAIATVMTKTNVHNMKMLEDSLKDTLQENLNFGAYEICKGVDAQLSFNLYNRQAVDRLIKENPKMLPQPRVDIPKDKRWNREKMNSAMAQAIIQGDSIKSVAKRLQKVTDMNQTSAIRNARTMMTGAQNAGRLERYKEAEAMGISLKKKWEATLDHVTRDSHVDVDGEVQDIDKPFSNGLDYPGAVGPPEQVYNCRCTMVSEIEGIKYSDKERFKALGRESYETWKSKQWRYGDGERKIRGKNR